ncbi:peptidase [Streptomyces sp. CB02130]|uniref:C40 family peptidase n=1 Tax=Streptomyces sp. CB02130 TaxID=1703934 RepID=UPI00093F2B03|nr:bifunctional lytic transglycosylase/C40 family peptidase [Streptomyces sp. CB02130]OKJ19403.1 peptidase [Streptomyces sp. CB02130]
MKVVVGAVAGVVGLILLIVIGAVVLIVEDDASAAETADGSAGLQGVPAEFRKWILRADAECKEPAMTPALLAAQLYQESKFQTQAVSHAGAQGPAQFIPGTWATWGTEDADGNGRISPWDIGDAVIAQGRMMCSLLKAALTSGYPGGTRALALAGYNAGWFAVQTYRGVPPYNETQNYVRIILSTMPRFEGPGGLAAASMSVSGSGPGPSALRRASTELGVKYSYGGGTPSGPSTGFCDGVNGYLNGRCDASRTEGWDCSSLVQYAYWPSIRLPRTASAQYSATSHRPIARGDLKQGDLLFWSNASGFIYHVAIYAGDGNVLHAPRTGKTVSLQPMASAMPAGDYLGATRP